LLGKTTASVVSGKGRDRVLKQKRLILFFGQKFVNEAAMRRLDRMLPQPLKTTTTDNEDFQAYGA
jgi:hypothetical protein